MTERNPVWSLYMHVNKINGKVYIGITSRVPQKRWGKNGNGYKDNSHFFNAIKKYGWENFQHYVVVQTQDEDLIKQCQICAIELAKSSDPEYGYNVTKGGDGYLKYTTQEQIEQRYRRQAQYRRQYSKNYYYDNKQKELRNANEYYKNHSQQCKQKSSKRYHDNRQELLKQAKEYRDSHVQEIKAYHKEYSKNNKQKIREYQMKYREAHKSESLQYAKAYREKQKEKKNRMQSQECAS